MDWLLGRPAEAALGEADAGEVGTWEVLLAEPDPQLYDWIMHGAGTPGPELMPLLARIRRFHGMAG